MRHEREINSAKPSPTLTLYSLKSLCRNGLYEIKKDPFTLKMTRKLQTFGVVEK